MGFDLRYKLALNQSGKIWEQGNVELQLKGVWGIPPSKAMGTVRALRVKEVIAERQTEKPHRREKRKAGLLTRHKSMSHKVCWPSWDGEFPSFQVITVKWLVSQPLQSC